MNTQASNFTRGQGVIWVRTYWLEYCSSYNNYDNDSANHLVAMVVWYHGIVVDGGGYAADGGW